MISEVLKSNSTLTELNTNLNDDEGMINMKKRINDKLKYEKLTILGMSWQDWHVAADEGDDNSNGSTGKNKDYTVIIERNRIDREEEEMVKINKMMMMNELKLILLQQCLWILTL